jgi:hypothetical protein
MSPHLVASCTSSVKAIRDDADAVRYDETNIFIKACSIDHSSIRPTPDPAYVSVTATSDRPLVHAGAIVGLVGAAAVPAGVAYARSGSLTTTVGPGLLIMGVGGVMAVAGGVMALVGAFTDPQEIDPRDEAHAMTRLRARPPNPNEKSAIETRSTSTSP